MSFLKILQIGRNSAQTGIQTTRFILELLEI